MSVDFIFLSETKCSVDDLNPIFSSWGLPNCSGVDSVDASGGLFISWSPRLDVVVLFKYINYVLCSISDELKNDYYLLCVYGSPYLIERATV